MKSLKQEFVIYAIVLVAMAMIWHNSSLLDKLLIINTVSNPFHPLEWAFVGYLLLWFPRAIFIGIKKYLIKKWKTNDTTGN